MLKYHSRDWTEYEDVEGGSANDELAEHLDAEGVYCWLRSPRHCGDNLLMNIGPQGDGSILPDDRKALVETVELIRREVDRQSTTARKDIRQWLKSMNRLRTAI